MNLLELLLGGVNEGMGTLSPELLRVTPSDAPGAALCGHSGDKRRRAGPGPALAPRPQVEEKGAKALRNVERVLVHTLGCRRSGCAFHRGPNPKQVDGAGDPSPESLGCACYARFVPRPEFLPRL